MNFLILEPLEMDMVESNQGRGPRATADMRARIAALRAEGADVVAVLWERHRRAEVDGEGYRYEFAAEGAQRVRQVG